MQNIERAVERLTKDHTEILDDAVGQSGPLLEVLREARYPNLGRTKGGSGTGDMLDVNAIALYEHIDGTVRAWLNHFRQHSTGDLLSLTERLYEILQAEEAGDRLDDSERMFAMFPTWVSRIEDHFDPPGEYEITAPCPECGGGRIENGEGALKWAVRVLVKPGHALIAECHACGRMWAGRDDLVELAERMAVEVDWVLLHAVENESIEQFTRL